MKRKRLERTDPSSDADNSDVPPEKKSKQEKFRRTLYADVRSSVDEINQERRKEELRRSLHYYLKIPSTSDQPPEEFRWGYKQLVKFQADLYRPPDTISDERFKEIARGLTAQVYKLGSLLLRQGSEMS